MGKECSKCKEIKSLEKFGNRSISKDGKRSQCRDCEKLYAASRKQSVDGLIKNIYFAQRTNALKRNMSMPTYSVEWLYEYIVKHSMFQDMYLEWVNSGYKTSLRPSIDRIDDSKSYTVDNIQLVTFRENYMKHKHSLKDGNDTRTCKAVIQFDKKMNKINRFKSLSSAARETNSEFKLISKVCRGERRTHNGFIWKFEDNNE